VVLVVVVVEVPAASVALEVVVLVAADQVVAGNTIKIDNKKSQLLKLGFLLSALKLIIES
jgi:hypothetical protein